MNIVAILLFIVLLILILYTFTPLLKGQFTETDYYRTGRSAQKEAALEISRLYDNLQDLRIEFEAGKMTEEEWKEITTPLMEKLERLESAKPDEHPAALNSERFCPGCAALISNYSRQTGYCEQCGTPLKEAANQ